MAGLGAPPKQAHARRRSNAPARDDWKDIPALAPEPLPDLPDEGWPARTLELHEGFRQDGATTRWTTSDHVRYIESMRLHADNPDRHAGELRLQWAELGLSQKGKQDRRWRVVSIVAEEGSTTPQVRRLRAVDA